jgi:hypothetical protein
VVVRDGQSRAYSTRYGARDPLLAPWPRLAAYLVWRGFIAVLRPAVFLMLLVAGTALLLSAVQRAPGAAGPQLSLDAQIELAFASAAPERSDRGGIWIDAVERALQSRPRAAPDLPLAESYLAAAIAIEGREALALGLLGEGRRTANVEADLRGRPAGEREARLTEAVEDLLVAGRDAGLDPPSLILAPPRLRDRLSRAQDLFGPALDEAGRWFVAPQGRALTVASLPAARPGAPTLYGDVRDVVVQGCALAQASGRQVGQCRVGFLPKPEADPILAGLSLAVLWADERNRPGARIVKAAYAAGHLPAAAAERIALGPDPALGREALLASAMPVLVDAGEAWTQPVRFQDALLRAAQEAVQSGRIEEAERAELFQAMGAVRREAGALAAVRLPSALRTPGDGVRLALLAERAGPQLLALSDLSPDALTDLLAEPGRAVELGWPRWPERARIELLTGSALILAALLLLFASLIAGFVKARGGRPGWFERLDGAATRLMLGKNS